VSSRQPEAAVASPRDDVAAAASTPVLRHSIYWRETEAVEPGPPLAGDIAADVCIVGGGYTGLWTAYFLKLAEPSLDIHVIEADYAGAGGSGHNDGFVTPTIGHSLETVVRRYGAERAKAAYAAVGRSILELRRFVRKHAIDAEFEPSGFYLVATNAAQRRRLEHDVAIASEMGVASEVLDADSARASIGSDAIIGALKTPGALVNPHRLARGLARIVRAQGVNVHERTRALAIERTTGGHVVTTPLGRVRAPRTLLATNAYQHQWAPFRRALKPVWSYAIVSEPLTDAQLAMVHWPHREGFVEARNFIVFCRLTADNRLLVGGGRSPYYRGCDMDERHCRDLAIHDVLVGELARYFPPWRAVRWTHAYGGCVAFTRELVPHVGAGAGGLFYAHGYCGNGIAMTHTAAKSLCDLILERDTHQARLLFVGGRELRFPPERVSFYGMRAVTALLEWQDRHPKLLKRQLV
jgi:glycine/D-amino acid oxidase-like deaminating enzyme